MINRYKLLLDLKIALNNKFLQNNQTSTSVGPNSQSLKYLRSRISGSKVIILGKLELVTNDHFFC